MAEMYNKIDGVYKDLNAKFEHLSSLFNQMNSQRSSSKCSIGADKSNRMQNNTPMLSRFDVIKS